MTKVFVTLTFLLLLSGCSGDFSKAGVYDCTDVTQVMNVSDNKGRKLSDTSYAFRHVNITIAKDGTAKVAFKYSDMPYLPMDFEFNETVSNDEGVIVLRLSKPDDERLDPKTKQKWIRRYQKTLTLNVKTKRFQMVTEELSLDMNKVETSRAVYTMTGRCS